jgi:uncharacterized membrane protein
VRPSATDLSWSLIAPIILSTTAVALFGMRSSWAAPTWFMYLPFNLALAWIPLVLSTLGVVVHRRIVVIPLGILWLAFLPNAAYMVTDLIHLGPVGPVAEIFDAVMFCTFAMAAMMAGAVSLKHVFEWLRTQVSTLLAASLVTFFALLAGTGVWLGRVHRYNSWDLATDPSAPLRDVADLFIRPAAHSQDWALALGCTGMLIALALSGRLWTATRRPSHVQ